MPDIYDFAQIHRAALLKRERQASTEMVRVYGDAWQRLRGQLDLLLGDMQLAIARGETVSPYWLLKQERLQTLLRQTEAELRDFGRFAESSVRAEQIRAIEAAENNLLEELNAALPNGAPTVTASFARLPAGAVQELAGFSRRGSALDELFDDYGETGAAAIRKALFTGLATGQNPRVIAARARQAFGGNLNRALVTNRNEIMRAYREASHQTAQANGDIIGGWIWHSAANRRTCAVCWALHGKFFPAGSRLYSHVQCRCTQIFVPKSFRELGIDADGPELPDIDEGDVLFANLAPTHQQHILGKAKFVAWANSQFDLGDLVGEGRDHRWGPFRYERSLTDILGKEERDRIVKGMRTLPKPERRAPTPKPPPVRELSFAERVQARIAKGVLSEIDVREVGDLIHREVLARDTIRSQTVTREKDAAEAAFQRAHTELWDENRKLTKLYEDNPEISIRDPRIIELNKRIDIVHERYKLAEAERNRLATIQAGDRAQTARDVLGEIRPMGGVKQNWAKGSNAKVKRLVDDGAARSYPTEWLQKSRDFGQMAGKVIRRGHYSHDEKWPAGSGRYSGPSLDLSQPDDPIHGPSVALHEMGHRFEHIFPELGRFQREFYERRTPGEKLAWLGPGFKREEHARRDKFLSPYMGKDYRKWYPDTHWELFTMGVEHVFEPRRYGWRFEDDPEYVDFILGLLAVIK